MRSEIIKIFSMCVFVLLLTTTIAVAQEETTEENAGVTPDSIWWGIDVALDNINLALTFDNEARAEKGLEIAEERLLEIKVMVSENKIKAMAKAESEHGKVVVKVKEYIENVEESNLTEEVKIVIKLEKKIGEHEADLDGIKQKIDIEIRGNLTEEQREMIDSILNNLGNQTGELKIKIVNKKDKTKIKIKMKTGKSEVEIEREVGKLEREIMGLKEKLEVEAKVFGNQSQIKLKFEFETETQNVSELIDEIIEKFSLDEASADALLKIKIEEEELGEDRFKIKAKIEEDISEVEIERRFTINSTEREDLVAIIVEISQLTKEDIELVWELKIEEIEEEEEEIECITDEDCEEGETCVESECEKGDE